MSDNILYGWNAIAELLHCCKKTAMTYERTERLPVHRLATGTVYALKTEIEEWIKQKPSRQKRQMSSEIIDPVKADWEKKLKK